MQPWLIYAILSAVFAALTNIFGKIGVADINSNMATWVRVIVIFCVLTPMVILRGEWLNPAQISSKAWTFLVLSGLATGASWLAYYRALQLGPASLVSPIDKSSVLLVMLLGVIFLGEHLSPKQWAGAALIAAGILVIAWPGAQSA